MAIKVFEGLSHQGLTSFGKIMEGRARSQRDLYHLLKGKQTDR